MCTCLFVHVYLRQLPGVEMIEVEAHMASYSLFATDHQRQVAHKQYKFWSLRFERSLQGAVRAMPKRHLWASEIHAHVMTLV